MLSIGTPGRRHIAGHGVNQRCCRAGQRGQTAAISIDAEDLPMRALALLKDYAAAARLPVGILVILALNLEEEFAVYIVGGIGRILQATGRLVDNAAAGPIGGLGLL